jgi:tetratricopeptide (TPR) repeat protein
VRKVALALACSLCLAIARPALADDGKETAAAALEDAGDALFDQADRESALDEQKKLFSNAARAYEDAYQLSPKYERIRSAASAWKRAGDDVRAADALETALAVSPAEADAADIPDLLAELDRSLARLELRSPKGTRAHLCDGRDRVGPTIVRLAAGSCVLTLSLPGGAATTQAVTLTPGALVVIQYPPPTPAKPRPPAPVPSGDSDSLLIAGATLLSVGLAGGAAAAVVTGFGYQADDEAEALGAGSPAEQRAVDLQRAAWGLAVPSVALSAVGTVLLILNATRPAHRSAEARLCAGPGAFGAALCGAF